MNTVTLITHLNLQQLIFFLSQIISPLQLDFFRFKMATEEVKESNIDIQWKQMKDGRDRLVNTAIGNVLTEYSKIHKLVDKSFQKALSKIFDTFQDNEGEAKRIHKKSEIVKSQLGDIRSAIEENDREPTAAEAGQIEEHTQEIEFLNTKYENTIPKFSCCFDQEMLMGVLNEILLSEEDDGREYLS